MENENNSISPFSTRYRSTTGISDSSLFIQILQIMLCLPRSRRAAAQRSRFGMAMNAFSTSAIVTQRSSASTGCAHNDRDKRRLIRQNCLFARKQITQRHARRSTTIRGWWVRRNSVMLAIKISGPIYTESVRMPPWSSDRRFAMFSTLTARFFIIERRAPDRSSGTTTVVQKVPVAETSACRTGLRVCAALATSGAEPHRTHSRTRPRATCYLPAPDGYRRKTSPPVHAPGERQHENGLGTGGKIVVGARITMQPTHRTAPSAAPVFRTTTAMDSMPPIMIIAVIMPKIMPIAIRGRLMGKVGLQHLGNRVDLRAAADANKRQAWRTAQTAPPSPCRTSSS